MTDDKDELIRELADKVKALEEKDKNRISTPWGVYDQKTFNLMFWGGIIIFTFAALFVAYIVTSDNPFGVLP